MGPWRNGSVAEAEEAKGGEGTMKLNPCRKCGLEARIFRNGPTHGYEAGCVRGCLRGVTGNTRDEVIEMWQLCNPDEKKMRWKTGLKEPIKAKRKAKR